MSRPLTVATGVLIAASTLSLAAQQPAAGTASRTVTRVVAKGATTKVLPGTSKDVFTTIQGNALSSTNGPLSNVAVRLRDARFGRISDTQLTDESGLFAFKAVEPGTYIVEIMGNDSNVLAASQLLNVNAGEAVSAVVKLPFRIPPFAALMGSSSTPAAAAVLTEAAASGIAAVVPTAPTSPVQ